MRTLCFDKDIPKVLAVKALKPIAQGRDVDTFQLTIEPLREGKLTIDGLITHRLPLEQWRKTINIARDKSSGSIRVVFDYQS